MKRAKASISISLLVPCAVMAAICSHNVRAASFTSLSVFASGANVNATGPDSITIGNGSVWVAYTNGLSGTGLNGSGALGNSTVVQYGASGNVQHSFSIAGSVDGLKIDPSTGLVWALQNQDGNSSVTLINPLTQALTPLSYGMTSPTQGYDDIVFKGTQDFLSYTNPSNSSAPTVVLLQNRTSPLNVTPIVTFGAHPSTQNDPDSLKLTPNGTLALTSGDDGAINFIDSSLANPFVSFLSLNDIAGDPFNGLDDTFFPTVSQGTLYITDTANNRVVAVQASGLTMGSIYAAVGNSTVNAVGSVDPVTGQFTSVISGLNRPHGLAFAPVPEPSTVALFAVGLLSIVIVRRRRISGATHREEPGQVRET